MKFIKCDNGFMINAKHISMITTNAYGIFCCIGENIEEDVLITECNSDEEMKEKLLEIQEHVDCVIIQQYRRN